MMIGVGHRRGLAKWLRTRPRQVICVEVTAEHFYDDGGDALESLAQTYPVFVHGLGLSLGTPGPIDPAALNLFAAVVGRCNPRWISEHVAFTRMNGVDLGHLNPVPLTKDSLSTISDHVVELQDRCQKPVILENITSHQANAGEMSEPEFLNAICERSGSGLLIDVTNLFINAHNHGYDARTWLHQLEPQYIRQLHIVGYSIDGRQLSDGHAERIQEDLMKLLIDVVAYGHVEAVILERDDHDADIEDIMHELDRLNNAVGAATKDVV